MLWVWNILWLSICHWCFKSSYWRWWMVGRSILWSIGEEIFLIIFMTTLPNGIYSFMYWPQIQVKVGIFSSFFSFIPSPPSFSFLHSFLLSSFLPLFLLTYTTLRFSLSLPSYLSSLFFSFFSLPPPLFPPCTSKLNSDLMNSHLQPQLTEETLISVGHLLSLGLMCIDEI